MVLLSLFIASQISEGDTTFQNLDSVYYRYELIESDTVLYDSLFVPVFINSTEKKDGELRISGTKDFSFDVDQGFDQGLKVSIAGEIEGVRVEGNLSDKAAPSSTIQLSEVEKISLHLTTANFYGGLGTLTLGLPFGITDEIHGSRISAHTRDKENDISAAYAVSRGTYRRLQFNGEEGKQSPYFLEGSVVAGSERIYLADGVEPATLLQRDVDYTIDYTSGIFSFTNRNIITNRSRIEIEYEQALQDYQNIYAESDGTAKFGSIEIIGMYRRKYDEKDDPLTFTLTPVQQDSLAAAGDSSIVRYTFADTSSEGAYILEDGYFVYVGQGNGDYIVTFFYAGENNGEYIYDPTIKGFVYQGPGLGNYSPTRLVPLPEAHDFFGIGADVYEMLSVELFGSDFDKNTFSAIDDEDNFGKGYRLNLDASAHIFRIHGLYVDYDSTLVMPHGNEYIDYQYQWNTTEPLERMGSCLVGVEPTQSLQIEAGYGILNENHKRKSLIIRPFFFDVGYEGIDSIDKYYTGLKTDVGRFSLGGRYEYIKPSHLMRYTIDYRLSKNTTFNLSGSYDKDTIGRGITTVLGAATAPLKLQLGHRLYNDTTFLFGNASVNIQYRGLSLIGYLQHSQRYSQKKDEVYVEVDEGEGNYVYDSTTNTYIEKEGGDYQRKVFLLPEFERIVSRTYSIEARYAQSLFDARGRFSYTDEENFTSYTNDLGLSLGSSDYGVFFDATQDISEDARYALASEKRQRYRFALTPIYYRWRGQVEFDESFEKSSDFVNRETDSYRGELSYRILLKPLLRPIISYVYSKSYSDFYATLDVRVHKPQFAVQFGIPILTRGRVETIGTLIYRRYTIDDVPFFFTANEPPGLTKLLNITGSLAFGRHTVFSLVYRLEFPPDNEYHQNLRFQTKIRF